MTVEIKRVAVVGAGNMGHQISICCALAGLETSCIDVSPEQLQKAESFMKKYLPERVAKGKLSEESARQAEARLRFLDSLEEGVREADFVIEAVTEKLDLKKSFSAGWISFALRILFWPRTAHSLSVPCWLLRPAVPPLSATCIFSIPPWS